MGLSASIPSSLASRLAGIASSVKDTASGLLRNIPFFKTKAQPPAISLAKHEANARKRLQQEEARRQGAMLAQARDPDKEAMLNSLPIERSELELATSYLLRPNALNIAKPIPTNIRGIIERMTDLKDTWITKMEIEPTALDRLKNKLQKPNISIAELIPDLGLLKQISTFYSQTLNSSPAPAMA